MRKWILCVALLFLMVIPVNAMEFTAPAPQGNAQDYLPSEETSFGDGLWYVAKSAAKEIMPDLSEAAATCLSVIAAAIFVSVLQNFPSAGGNVVDLTGTVLISLLLFRSSNSLIRLGIETVNELSEYGKLLLPIMTGAMAAQGGVTSSAALYTGTAVFNGLLTGIISHVIVPLLYFYLCLCITKRAVDQPLLDRLSSLAKWFVTWTLRLSLYIFSGYMTITGVVSGTADAAAVKATKLALSGMIPVVGGIISDASETILVGAGVMKSAAGVSGLLAIIATAVGPFLRLGVHYLILKATAGICSVFGSKRVSGTVQDFSSALGLVLGMTGAVVLLLLISTVCFLRGIA